MVQTATTVYLSVLGQAATPVALSRGPSENLTMCSACSHRSAPAATRQRQLCDCITRLLFLQQQNILVGKPYNKYKTQ